MEYRQLRTISGDLQPLDVPPPAIEPLDEAGISKVLQTIFEEWPSSAAYRYCLQDLPGNGFPVATWNVAQAAMIKAAGPAGVPTQRFNWVGANANNHASVLMSVPAGLRSTLP